MISSSTITASQRPGLLSNAFVGPIVTIRPRRRGHLSTVPRPGPCQQQLLLHAYPDGLEDVDGGDQLASEFAAHINQLSLKAPLQHRRPSPLDPPTASVAAQMDALQINDWPELDAGVQTAFAFAKPYQCEDLATAVAGQGDTLTAPFPPPSALPARRHSSSSSSRKNATSSSTTGSSSSSNEASTSSSSSSSSSGGDALVRSWSAREAWLTPQEFAAELHSQTYAPLLGCDSWRACSTMVFPATRVGQRAVQAVEVLANSKAGSSGSNGGSQGTGSNGNGSGSNGKSLQRYTYTFLLERITSGPYRNCWLTVGVRPGNYAV